MRRSNKLSVRRRRSLLPPLSAQPAIVENPTPNPVLRRRGRKPKAKVLPSTYALPPSPPKTTLPLRSAPAPHSPLPNVPRWSVRATPIACAAPMVRPSPPTMQTAAASTPSRGLRFKPGDLVLCMYSTYPLWPARIQRQVVKGRGLQFVTLLPTRSDDEVLAYWCVFSGESDGGWVRADRVLEYHPLLLTRVRVKFDDEWYSAQKKALDFAQKEYFRACNDDEPIRDLTSETNKLVNELLILVNRTRNYPDDEDELLTVCDSDSVSTLPESPPRDVKPIIRKRKQVRETPRKRQRRAPRHDASSSAFSSAINHPRGSIKRELIEANRASSDRDEPSKRAAEAQASDAEEDEDEPDSPSESEDNATEYTPPAYIKSEPREELTYTPATMALPRAGSRRRRMPKRVLPNRAAARRQAGATSPDFDDEQRITRIEKPVRRREQEVAHLPRQKSQLCRDAGALAPSGFPTYAQCMRSTDAQLFRQCAEKIRTTVSKFQESVDKCARKLEEYQEAERGVRYAYNCMQNAVGETEERFIGAQTTLQSILDLARSTRYRTAGSDVEEE